MSCQLWRFMHLFGFVEGLATLLYAQLPRPVSLRVQHGFQLFQRRSCYLKEGNNMLAPILAFFCSKFPQHLFSIM